MTILQDIKSLVFEIEQNFKNNKSKRNKELTLLKNYVKKSDLYNGKKKKLYKHINSSKNK